ncbi:5-oxoprolinase subunit PxpB [Paenibacillus sp. J5C_2022]|uniref:5-oxoprolinase subunit PxpB n=1 Tax=Paenibacillus sp. J5C2022 TaxID=2977129 RepID=UPI0021D3C854|nr:5-oxoprolinase subunit PxpB [Paenibacillus sp. J5C2022]MCU6711229.1 5-oxoprolinase subunit PxpB [Paenibacillus sp. J5C2022]
MQERQGKGGAGGQAPPHELLPLGECGVIIRLGNELNEATHRKVMAVLHILEEGGLPGVKGVVPAFASVTIHYDPVMVWRSRSASEGWHASIYETVCERLDSLLAGTRDGHMAFCEKEDEPTVVTIPVCYGGEYGPDLDEVARFNGLTPEEVIAIHSEPDYLVYMIGFAPGFPYLGGMSERIASPRRQTPRTSIPAGSVGIAGKQTGVYPLATPGGWQLIGRTPLSLFRPEGDIPTLLKAGDLVRFLPIEAEEYGSLLGQEG